MTIPRVFFENSRAKNVLKTKSAHKAKLSRFMSTHIIIIRPISNAPLVVVMNNAFYLSLIGFCTSNSFHFFNQAVHNIIIHNSYPN